MKQKVSRYIHECLGFDLVLEKPKDTNFGHFAAPVFFLAKEFRKSPNLIAIDLAKKLENESFFSKIEPIGGYINFTLSNDFLDDFAQNFLHFKPNKKNEKILVEFVSANPTGPLHIGHVRGGVFGDSLCRIGSFLGYDILSEYYINDAGHQMHLLALSIFLDAKEQILKQKVQFPQEYYRGEYIHDLANKACEKFGKEIFEDEKNLSILQEFGKNEMLNLIKQNLKSIQVEIKNFVSEKEIFQNWDKTLQKLKQNSAIYEEDDKIWLNSTKYHDEKNRVIIREDKRATYLAADIIYHENKFLRKFDTCINIWGADHHGYIQRVKASLEFLGYNSDKLEIILAQMVSLLKGGLPFKMSKRKGQYILLSDVVEEIGSDALRYIFLSKKCDTHLEFDLDLLKNTDSSNPIYYINYAHARINQVFEKSNFNKSDIKDIKLTNLNNDGKNLLFFALNLFEVLENAFNTRELQKVCNYLKDLSSMFHKFYNENKVIGSENEKELLKLFYITAFSIKQALNLIGINAKDKM